MSITLNNACGLCGAFARWSQVLNPSLTETQHNSQKGAKLHHKMWREILYEGRHPSRPFQLGNKYFTGTINTNRVSLSRHYAIVVGRAGAAPQPQSAWQLFRSLATTHNAVPEAAVHAAIQVAPEYSPEAARLQERYQGALQSCVLGVMNMFSAGAQVVAPAEAQAAADLSARHTARPQQPPAVTRALQRAQDRVASDPAEAAQAAAEAAQVAALTARLRQALLLVVQQSVQQPLQPTERPRNAVTTLRDALVALLTSATDPADDLIEVALSWQAVLQAAQHAPAAWVESEVCVMGVDPGQCSFPSHHRTTSTIALAWRTCKRDADAERADAELRMCALAVCVLQARTQTS